ncbi:MAG: hypothetical protein ILO36_05950 [Abditibacteriota bacterium]|nr:hypothetical protein [Abditibacteriota bacterium]
MKKIILLTAVLLLSCGAFGKAGVTLSCCGIKDAAPGFFDISGHVAGGDRVYLRVTEGKTGRSFRKTAPAGSDGCFSVRYPFGRGKAREDIYYIDASPHDGFGGEESAEGAVICFVGSSFPELPSAFTNDLLDKRGRRDAKAKEFPQVRRLLNLYMNSKGARLSGRIYENGFDLARPEDLAAFKKDFALYDFAGRDKGFPLGNRPARCFWQSVWPSWFNSTNDHPLDNDPENNAFGNYMPYAFSNDFSDILIMYLMRLPRFGKPFDDNLAEMCRQGTENLMAMQNASEGTLALTDHRGIREKYTKGAFRYGMFVNGDFMTEGTGWFYNPAFLDYAAGGVLNGRCIWALCESAVCDPGNPQREKVKEAIRMGLGFCLRDGFDGGYTKTDSEGHPYWRDAGEHAYLSLGLAVIAGIWGNETAFTAENGRPVSFKEACKSCLDALCCLQSEGRWSVYPNVDSMAVAALSEGCRAFAGDPCAERWKKCAVRGADYWLSLYVRRSEFGGEAVNFGLSLVPGEMTYRWGRADGAWKAKGQFFYYQTGHWLQALASLYTVTGDIRYLDRCRKIAEYLLGNNPPGIRIFSETGGVYNWAEDTDGDGAEDTVYNNMYPESTAFCQIGLMYYFDALGKYGRSF